MSKNIRVQEGNLVVELDAATSVVAANPSTDGFDARIHMSLGGIISESTGGVGGFEADTWAAGDKGYVGVYNDETGQYSEFAAHGSTFGAGSLNSVFYTTTSVSPLDFLGDYKVMMQLESTSAANTFVNVTDGTILRIWDDTEVDNVAIQHDGTNLVFTPTTTNAIALEGLYFDMLEIADPTFVADPGRGRIWVESSVPNRLMFTDDAGNDIVVAEFGTGPVNATGSPLNNQIAVFVDGDTIEGDANFTWDASHLVLGVTPAADAVTPTLAFGDGDTGFYEDIDDSISIAIATTQRFSFNASAIQSSSTGGSYVLQGPGSATIPNFTFVNDINTGVGKNADDQLSLISGGVEMLRLAETGVTTTDQIIINPGVTLRGAAATPLLAFGDGDSGFYESVDDQIQVSIGGTDRFFFLGGTFGGSLGNSAPALFNEGATNTNPTVAPYRGDLDTGLGGDGSDTLSLIAGGVEMLRATETGVATTDQVTIAPGVTIRGAAATPSLAFGDGDSGFYENADDELSIAVGGARQWYYSAVSFRGNAGDSPALENNTPSSTDPNIIPNRSDLDTGIGWTAADQLSLVAGAKEMLRLSETGTATTDQIIIAPAGIIGTDATPALAFGDGDSGFYENVDDEISVSIAATRRWYFNGNTFQANATNGPYLENSTPSAINPTIAPNKSDNNTGIGWNAADELSLITGAVEASRLIARTVQTTGATQAEIAAVAVASGEGFGFEIHVMGTEDSTGDTVFERIFGAIRNQAGTTALVGSTVVDRTDDAGATTWTITVAADDATDQLTVDVQGEALHTIDWKCRVHLLNV